MKIAKAKLTLEQTLPWILLVGGLIGLYCAFVLTLDEIHLLKDPTFQPDCNINPVISCGSVMQSDQAHLFGFPNPLLGIATFTALAVVGGMMLAGAKFKRWFWLALNGGLLLGVIFVHWLFYETVYRIGNLCPYCMGVWVVTITPFWYVTLYNIQHKYLALPAGRLQAVGSFFRRHHLDFLILWFLIIFALILKHFWYYYGRNL